MLYCRSCQKEVPEGDRCPACGLELLPAGPTEDDHDKELVAVLRTSDSNLLPVVKSMLDAAGIPYVVQGDEAMGLFPLGPFGGGMIRRVLGAAILVPRDREEEARQLLEGNADADFTDSSRS